MDLDERPADPNERGMDPSGRKADGDGPGAEGDERGTEGDGRRAEVDERGSERHSRGMEGNARRSKRHRRGTEGDARSSEQRLLVRKPLLAIVDGSRDSALAQDARLDYRSLPEDVRKQPGWTRMMRDPEVYAKGRVRHADHKTIVLETWHRVFMNTEAQSPAAANVVFLD